MKPPSLFCFDVFDTVLTRLVGYPSSIFYFVGQRLAHRGMVSLPPEEFQRKRREAETRARLRHPHGEIHFVAIWEQLASDIELPATLIHPCMEEELRVEQELLRPVPGARERVFAAAKKGKVVYVSNMYLPAAFLEKQLREHDLWPPDSALYVSCDHGCSKDDGSLFRAVLAKEDKAHHQAIHFGNDAKSDVRGARAARIAATHYPDSELNRFEWALESGSAASDGIGALMAGASRLTRLQVQEGGPHQRAIWTVGAGVAGPALTAYLIWVFQRARELRLRRLYFVSRDGQILLDMARVLAAKWNLDFELRYLYASRQAWHLPSITAVTERDLSWILEATDFFSVESALARVSVKPEEIRDALIAAGFAPDRWTRHLTDSERHRLRAVLMDDSVSRVISQAANRESEILVHYLRQEGLFDSVPSAIVDVGWTGRAMDSLVTVLTREGAGVPYGFFFGLFGSGPKPGSVPPRSPREGFYIDVYRDKPPPPDTRPLPIMLEMFCAGDHGQVRRFTSNNGEIEPVLRAPVNIHAMNWGLAEFRHAVAAFVHTFVWHYRDLPRFEPLASIAGSVFEQFWKFPSPEIARAWGGFPYFDDQGESTWSPLAEPYGLRDVREVARAARGYDIRRHGGAWHQGSVAQSPAPLRFAFRAAAKLGPRYIALRTMIRRRTGL